MFVKTMYNTIASQYDMADCYGAISRSHQCALEQIHQAKLAEHPDNKILDLGVGDGAFLRKLKLRLPHAEYTGIDVSREMLKRASEGVSFKAIEASAAEATNYIPPNSQDLVLAHFINAYIPTDVLFSQAQKVTRENGLFSVITTTYESFPVAQKYLADFIAKGSILSNIVGHYYKAVVKNTPVAAGEESLLKALRDHQFEILDHQRIAIPMTLENIDELQLFGIEAAWFLNTLSVPVLPRGFLLQRIRRMFSKMFTFPYHDTHIIDVVLARK